MQPLVTAIMPTRGRRQWAFEALQIFQAQTYENREIVIVDDRMEPSFPNLLQIPGVVHLFAPRLPIGGKRNLAVGQGRGEIIMHWDSDDIYSPDRMAHQVGMLLSHDVDMVGYHSMLFIDVESGARYAYCAHRGYCIGVSQTYWRDTWEARNFDAVDQGEDNSFLTGRRTYTEDAAGRIVARIHGGNTCDKRKHIPNCPEQWRLA